MSAGLDRIVNNLGQSVIVSKVLKPLVEVTVFFVWLIYLVDLLRSQNYNSDLVFDLFLARVGGPTASHATTYLIFLSIFPVSYVLLRSIIPAFLVEILAFDIHEGLWQVAYYVAWHSTIDRYVWLLENGLDTFTALFTVIALVVIYRFPAKFFVVVATAWAGYLLVWLAIGFPVSVLTKLAGNQTLPSPYNTTLWVNQIEFLSWLYFALILLVCLRYFCTGNHSKRRP